MNDNYIVGLFWERSELAIEKTQEKYGPYCESIAKRILGSQSDAEECVNDAILKAWNSIPPNRPESLSAYLGKITRNTALNRYSQSRAKKRSSSNEAVLGEVLEIIPPSESTDFTEEITIRDAVNRFLRKLPDNTRIIFVRRYWFMSSINEIASDLGLSQSNVKVTLMRTRDLLREHLKKEGINV